MDPAERIDELLQRNLAKEKAYGNHRAWIQVAEVKSEEWGKDLSIEQVHDLIDAVLRPPKWYPLDVQPSEMYEIAGYEYTDAEGAARTQLYRSY